jgi:hypothetical protein
VRGDESERGRGEEEEEEKKELRGRVIVFAL